MRFLALAALILALVSPALTQAAPCQSCQRPTRFPILNAVAACRCGAACDCGQSADCQCDDADCQAARSLGEARCSATPVRSALRQLRPVRRTLGLAREAACTVRRVVANRPRLLRRLGARVFGGCR